MELIDFLKYENKALLKYIQGICFRQLILVSIFFYFFIVYGQVDIGENIIIQNFQQFVVQDICRDLLLESRLENNGDTMEGTSVVGLESIVAIHIIKRNKKYKSNLQKTQNVKIGKCYKAKIGNQEYGKRATLLLNEVNALQKNKYYKIQFSNRTAAIGNFSIWQEMIFPNSIFIQISPRILTTYPKASNERMILHKCMYCFIIRPPPYLLSTIA
ncbi:hypothetical protein [uncultured Chryseobacterium sp.]|uniref:hypothetical protein n=1 Tax=uncultured Chryseobacterium sp. TaxID=259322 RepID=UPI00258F8F0F|nr:hypothetical protein [uncultured Chryseobacterium sp.]